MIKWKCGARNANPKNLSESSVFRATAWAPGHQTLKAPSLKPGHAQAAPAPPMIYPVRRNNPNETNSSSGKRTVQKAV
jgi:hypothetical protein